MDTVNYEKAPKGQSYNKTSSGWAWSGNLTPAKTNIISQKEDSSKNNNQENKTAKTENMEENTAAVSQKLPKSSNFLFIFLIAFILAIFSGVIFIVIKKKFLDSKEKLD